MERRPDVAHVTTATRTVGERSAVRSAGLGTGAFRFSRAALVVFLAASIDVFNFLDRGNQARYALVLIPVGSIVLIRLRQPSAYIRRMAATDRILLLLWLFGIAGTLYGVFFEGSTTTARPIFVPMIIAFLYLWTIDVPTDDEVRRLLRWVAWIGAVYIVLAAAVNTGFIPGLAQYRQFRNAQLGFGFIGLAAAIVLKRWSLLVVLAVLSFFNFLAYPSATSILVTIAMILTLFATRPKASRARPYVVALCIAVAALFAILNLPRGIESLDEYFSAVNKYNATYGRLSVWASGIERFQLSPAVGQAFSGGTVATATRIRGGSEIQIPYHNDYVLFLAEGGLLGFGLLIAWIVTLEATLLRRYRGFVDAGMQDRADLLRVLLVGFNCFFAAMAFNPVLEGMSRSATVFALYGVALALGPPPRVARRGTWVGSSPTAVGGRPGPPALIPHAPGSGLEVSTGVSQGGRSSYPRRRSSSARRALDGPKIPSSRPRDSSDMRSEPRSRLTE
jgi:O-antigen ligase